MAARSRIVLHQEQSKARAAQLAQSLIDEGPEARNGFMCLLNDGTLQEKIAAATLLGDMAIYETAIADRLYATHGVEMRKGLLRMLQENDGVDEAEDEDAEDSDSSDSTISRYDARAECRRAALHAIAGFASMSKSKFITSFTRRYAFEVRGGLLGLVQYSGHTTPTLTNNEAMCAIAALSKFPRVYLSFRPEHVAVLGNSIMRCFFLGNDLEKCSAATTLVNLLQTAPNSPFRQECRRLYMRDGATALLVMLAEGGPIVRSYTLRVLARMCARFPRSSRIVANVSSQATQAALVQILDEGLTLEDKVNAACMIAVLSEVEPNFGRGLDHDRAVERLERLRTRKGIETVTGTGGGSGMEWVERAVAALAESRRGGVKIEEMEEDLSSRDASSSA